jgi:hypothetical protein
MYAGDGDAWETEFMNYNGSYTLYYPGTEPVNHMVLIVGWDDSLIHAGGTGGWIVKNSWGTDWGGTCGYGTERGYFTIAYGSASIGTDSCFVYAWQDYDPNGGIMFYDEVGGWTSAWGCSNTTGWGLCKFILQAIHTSRGWSSGPQTSPPMLMCTSTTTSMGQRSAICCGVA